MRSPHRAAGAPPPASRSHNNCGRIRDRIFNLGCVNAFRFMGTLQYNATISSEEQFLTSLHLHGLLFVTSH